MTPEEIQVALSALGAVAGLFPNLSFSVPMFGADVKLTVSEISGVLNGTPTTISIQPFKSGKFSLAFVENGITLSV